MKKIAEAEINMNEPRLIFYDESFKRLPMLNFKKLALNGIKIISNIIIIIIDVIGACSAIKYPITVKRISPIIFKMLSPL